MSEGLRNLYIFTGKGGVGKTTLSIAFAKHLSSLGNDVLHISFKNQSLDDSTFLSTEAINLCEKAGVKGSNLELKEAAKQYMGKKLGSKMIANWIANTAFFKSLVNMLPGFNYLIYMGKILEMIHESGNKLIIVLDSPSSGHALTMIESTKNFKDIFQKGIIFDDTNKMLSLLNDPEFTQVNILTLPTEMAIHEAIDLHKDLSNLCSGSIKIFSNNTLNHFAPEILEKGPEFLKNKYKLEKKVLDEHQEKITFDIPQSLETSFENIIKEVVPLMKNLV
jgi:anion-transporting  ArsA/GET3 family ATPase